MRTLDMEIHLKCTPEDGMKLRLIGKDEEAVYAGMQFLLMKYLKESDIELDKFISDYKKVVSGFENTESISN